MLSLLVGLGWLGLGCALGLLAALTVGRLLALGIPGGGVLFGHYPPPALRYE